MSRWPDPELEPEPEEPAEPEGQIGTTGPAAVVGLGLAGLVAGWALRPASIELVGAAPTVSWLPVLALFLVAAIMVAVAWSTHRAVQVHRRHLPPHQAVNRLVLAKACVLAGAVIAGGYLGYSLSWLGLAEGDLAQQRMIRSFLAGIAGVAIVAGSIALERACRVSRDDNGA